MENIQDLVGAPPTVEPVAEITAAMPDPVGAVEAAPPMYKVSLSVPPIAVSFTTAMPDPVGELQLPGGMPPADIYHGVDVLEVPAPPGGVLQAVPNLEAAVAAAEADVVRAPDAQFLFPSSEGVPIVNRIVEPPAERKVHREPDDRGFKYAWQRNRADRQRY